MNNHKGMERKTDREVMKSLSFGMASDLSQLLADQGFGQNPIDIVEALVFAMFIIADTYSLAKPEKDRALEVIHGFYDDMQSHFIKKVIISDRQITDEAEIQSVSEMFHDLSRNRFEHYKEKFQQDITDSMGAKCSTTVNSLLDHLFIEPLTNAEKLQLIGPVSERVLYFWTGCVQNFK